jgi:hypothetical protein
MPAWSLQILQVNGKQGPAVLNNKRIFNQINGKNSDKRWRAFEKFKKPAANHTWA